jgi:hypothetical protein
MRRDHKPSSILKYVLERMSIGWVPEVARHVCAVEVDHKRNSQLSKWATGRSGSPTEIDVRSIWIDRLQHGAELMLGMTHEQLVLAPCLIKEVRYAIANSIGNGTQCEKWNFLHRKLPGRISDQVASHDSKSFNSRR